jgi:hypothetical protein
LGPALRTPRHPADHIIAGNDGGLNVLNLAIEFGERAPETRHGWIDRTIDAVDGALGV